MSVPAALGLDPTVANSGKNCCHTQFHNLEIPCSLCIWMYVLPLVEICFMNNRVISSVVNLVKEKNHNRWILVSLKNFTPPGANNDLGLIRLKVSVLPSLVFDFCIKPNA